MYVQLPDGLYDDGNDDDDDFIIAACLAARSLKRSRHSPKKEVGLESSFEAAAQGGSV
jgi:hypothetical protein